LYDHTRSDVIVRRLRHRGHGLCGRYRRRRLGSGLGHILLTARNKAERKEHGEKKYLLCHTQIKNQMGRRINDDRVTKLALHHPIS
ncbi:MAG: hypothetical protein HXN41_11375, partial [Prevotella histicola]|uniref:hypothetical protein n=1 Tax=Prevotella histicola TaxID=470565 RepID=UPI001CB15AD1